MPQKKPAINEDVHISNPGSSESKEDFDPALNYHSTTSFDHVNINGAESLKQTLSEEEKDLGNSESKLQIDTDPNNLPTSSLESAIIGSSGSFDANDELSPRANPEHPMFLSMFNSRFSTKLSKIYFQPEFLSIRHSARGQQMLLVRRLALHAYKEAILNPHPSAITRTKRAVKDFFRLAHQFIYTNDEMFPLANKNKCLGFAVFKGNKTVFVALSQDKDARKDDSTRKNLLRVIKQINQIADNPWRFELVKTPTAMEYILPRTLLMETPRPASDFEIQPRMRCVEIHLMVALNKARGSRVQFDPQDMAMIACSGTLWAHGTESVAIPHFGNVRRNPDYLFEPAETINLVDGSTGYVEYWEPCKEHCAKYYQEMLAVAAADKHFHGPRTDEPIEPLNDLPTITLRNP